MGDWHCVACGLSVDPDRGPLWTAGWLTLGCGRLCRGCAERLADAPAGSWVDLGAGCKLAVVEDKEDRV